MSENTSNSSGQSKRKSVSQVGDFELKKRLGKGGMGEVFLGRQISLDRLVAIKTLSRELAKKEDFVARFLREARAMAKLDHTNVVKVYAVDSYKGIHFAAIEYVDGKSVQDWLNKLKTFSVGDAVHITMVCAEALVHAHSQSMVHRDIKPDNILLTSKGVVKVADFGLAKVLDDDVSMTQSGTGLGTPLYMAPEQARSAKTVDHRSDVYALGATLYHMLTGNLPFTGGSALELILAKETGTYTPARKSRAEIPDKLDYIIDKMMAKDPNHRYDSCRDIVYDLAALGIHSDALSFIDGAEPTGVGRSAAPTRALGSSTVAGSGIHQTSSQRQSGVSQISSREDAKRTDKAKKNARTWFVQFADAEGQLTVERLSTRRVLKQIKAGTLTPKARAKASAAGNYVPLAEFPEFTAAIEDQLSQHTAAIRQKDMTSLYSEVERDQKRRVRWRWIRGKLRNFVGMISLIIWLAVIAAVGLLIFVFGRSLFEYLGSKVQEMMG